MQMERALMNAAFYIIFMSHFIHSIQYGAYLGDIFLTVFSTKALLIDARYARREFCTPR